MVVGIGAGLGLGTRGTEAARDDAVGGVVSERLGSRACESRVACSPSDPGEVLGLARDVAFEELSGVTALAFSEWAMPANKAPQPISPVVGSQARTVSPTLTAEYRGGV